jgi:CRP-like cAMP-binding protein
LTVISMTAFEFRRLEAEHPDIAQTLTDTMQDRLQG